MAIIPSKWNNQVYRAFYNAKRRCTVPSEQRYASYGGRGIKFRFRSFKQFCEELGPKPAGYTLDRIDNDGHYEPGNIRWATYQQQSANSRSTYFGTRTIDGGQALCRLHKIDEAREAGQLTRAEWLGLTGAWIRGTI